MAQNKFAEILSSTRKRRGISQKQAALELGISQAQLSHYEKGIRECNFDFLIKAADYYGVSCDYLLGHSTAKISRSSAAARHREITRALEVVLLLLEHAKDETLTKTLTAFYKNQIYRGLKIFDGVCDGLYFIAEDESIHLALAEAEAQFALAFKEAQNIKELELPLHENSLEHPTRIINEIETALYERGLI